MKNYQLLFFNFLMLTLFTTSCGEDRAVEENVAYEVEVEIISPADNSTFAIGETFEVEVDYARAENTIHNVKVEILDAAGNQVMNLVERHAHVANEFTFKMDAVKIDQAGTYTIRAATTDLQDDEGAQSGNDGHDSEERNLVEHTINIQQ